MPEPLRPAAVSLYGRQNWVLVMTVASTTFVPTAAEVNAASALDITNIAFADTGQPTQSTNRVQQERRLGDTRRAEFNGDTNITGGDMHYQFNPQAATGADGKKLYEKIPAGTNAFLVQRLGVAKATNVATGQFVNCYPVQFGPSFPSQAGDGETAESGMVCTFAITDPNPAISVALT